MPSFVTKSGANFAASSEPLIGAVALAIAWACCANRLPDFTCGIVRSAAKSGVPLPDPLLDTVPGSASDRRANCARGFM